MNNNFEKGFKDTEVGLFPEDWEIARLGDCLELIRNGTTRKQNKDSLGYPVTRIETIADERIDSGKMGYIADLSDGEVGRYRVEKGDILLSHINSEPHLGKSAIYEGSPPILIHGMNLLLIRARKDSLNPYFLNYLFNFYRLKGIFIGLASRAVGQSSINQGRIKTLKIFHPPLPEQRNIARVLSTIQRAVEQQDKIIGATKKLKKSLVQKLFTEGLNGEEQKETEIGLVPKSWEVVRLGEVVEKARQTDPRKNPDNRFKYIDVSGISNKFFQIKEYFGKDAPSRARKLIETGDIIFATVRPYLKRVAIVPETLDGEICSTAFCVVRCKRELADPTFIFNYLVTDTFVDKTTELQRGSSYPAVTDKDVLNQRVLLSPLPEQQEIARILNTVDRKIEAEERRKATLKELFRTMLHKLMTGEIRVRDVEFKEG